MFQRFQNFIFPQKIRYRYNCNVNKVECTFSDILSHKKGKLAATDVKGRFISSDDIVICFQSGGFVRFAPVLNIKIIRLESVTEIEVQPERNFLLYTLLFTSIITGFVYLIKCITAFSLQNIFATFFLLVVMPFLITSVAEMFIASLLERYINYFDKELRNNK